MKSLISSSLLAFFSLYLPPLAAQSVEDFARLPAVSYPQISPSGNSVSYVVTHEDTPVIVTKDLNSKDPKHALGVIPLKEIHLNRYIWGNEDRLVIEARMTVKRHRFGEVNINRLFSIGRDGKDLVIFDMQPNKRGYFLQYPRVVHPLPDDPQHMLIQLDHGSDHWATAPVHKVNIYTGEKTVAYANRRGYFRVVADHKGNVRVGVLSTKGGTGWNIYYRLDGSDNWQVLQKTRFDDTALIHPVRFDYTDPNILLITSEDLTEGENLEDKHLYRYDLTKMEVIGKHSAPIADNAKAIVEQSFPDVKVDLVSAVHPVTLDTAIYKLFSDTVPAQYILFDLLAKRIDFLGASYPQLENATLSPMKKVDYQARDGLTIPAYLTLPAASSKKAKPKLPLIVYPHGGPWARDYWGFNNYVQFFANEGYAVFQPQFRGSVGFGSAHEQAGYQQWGLGIQDDITDGVQWLIDEQIVHPDRICIVGASFGGYAAAMGLATTPSLYRCGISINGVLDMPRFLDSINYYLFSSLNRQIINSKWGVKKVSPYHLHKQISAPLLLIAGEKDTVVDNKHSTRLYKRLKKNQSPVQYLELPKGEHWRTIESNEIKTLQAMQNFLQQHLQQPNSKEQHNAT